MYRTYNKVKKPQQKRLNSSTTSYDNSNGIIRSIDINGITDICLQAEQAVTCFNFCLGVGNYR